MERKCPICGAPLVEVNIPNASIKGDSLICLNCGYKSSNDIEYKDVVSKYMADKENIELIQKTLDKIGEMKDERYIYLTYRVVPQLKMLEFIYEQATIRRIDDIAVGNQILRYLSTSYAHMDRYGLAIKYDKLLLANDVILLKRNQKEKYFEQIKDDITNAVRNRNIYDTDKCSDILLQFSSLINDNVLIDLLRLAPNKKHTHTIKDKVELTGAYLNVIDEVEKKLDMMDLDKGMGSNFKLWKHKKELLAQKGVLWHTPEELNPDIKFD